MFHLSARLAWHLDGWNGRICSNPAANTYCVGPYSYPGTMIADRRDIEWEQANKGQCCTKIDSIPPCIYSINAFGSKELVAFADPPEFFNDSTKQRQWELPPATVCVWPYEAMYDDNVRKESGGYDNDRRLEAARDYFAQLEENHSLIFYYANYSNPYSEEDQRRYVIVGVSRLREIGEELFYENCSPETKKKFGGGFVWSRNITSHYPDQGLRLPYHLYMDHPDMVEKFLFVPDNPRNFKYGTRLITDDDALDLVERFLEITATLREMGDTSEDWSARIAWLQSLIAELWSGRGLYPGLAKVLDYLNFGDAIPFLKTQVAAGKEQETKEAILDFLDGKIQAIKGLNLSTENEKKVLRQWKLFEDEEKRLLRDVLPRFDLRLDQIERILSSDRANNGIYSSLKEISENPYILSEEFIGDGPDDTISFNKIDHGMFPSPDLGGQPLADKDDWHRLRGLCVERLKREERHTFMPAVQVIHDINHKLSFLPEWKRHQFTEKYLTVDEEELSGALTFREENGRKYIYLKPVFEAEREIEKQIQLVANSPDITFKSPVTKKHWYSYLYDPNSPLAERNPKEYEKAIQGQIKVCQRIFVRPVCVLSGEAGTGKTTVIKAIIQAIEKAHGTGTSFQLLAPTGKAAERLREKTKKNASTIHSFLAQRGWLNDNLTFKRSGGRRENGISTYIIDESSMLDLELTATLFRAINWASVQRLIFVGDPNQLPPIGRGRVFADIIDWLQEHKPESVGVLKTNIRQMENRLNGKGTGILDLASLYIRTGQVQVKDEEAASRAEQILGRIQEGGEIDKDLRVVYWNNPDDLVDKLITAIISDMEKDTGQAYDEKRPYYLWTAAFKGKNDKWQPEYQQIISPYRGEQFGTDHLNKILQKHANGNMLDRVGHMSGVTLFDKVIQIVNRPKSNPVWAYCTSSRRSEKIEIFNGEIGFVEPDLRDCKKNRYNKIPWLQSWFTLNRFHILFSRKPQYRVSVESRSFVEENIELAYAISVHKAQGSEFEQVYFVLPKHKKSLLSREMLYTGLTRASRHCTILVEEDISPLLSMRRLEKSHLIGINSSLFSFRPVPEEMHGMREWYEEGKIHQTLADYMVRSKSEVIIANMLFERDIPFRYEVPLFAPDGTFYLPDFTITWRGEEWYWEHLGLLDRDEYRNHWETKKQWYDRFFPGRLIVTQESGNLSHDANKVIETYFS